MLTIDNVSYDDYVVTDSYDVQEDSEYGGTDYIDGWWKKHRSVVRTRVKGKVTLAMKPSVYSTFIAALNSGAGVEGDHTVTILVQNTGATKTITAYIDTNAKTAISTPSFGSQAVFFNITLTIEER